MLEAGLCSRASELTAAARSFFPYSIVYVSFIQPISLRRRRLGHAPWQLLGKSSSIKVHCPRQ